MTGRSGYTVGGDEIREESSWRYPLLIFFITLVLCVVVLYHYVGPDVDDLQGLTPKPTVSDDRTVITVGDVSFSVPANYTVYPRDRRPGEREALSLYASWPRMDGYTPARRADFVENRADAPRIDIVIEKRNLPLSEADRLELLYRPQAIEREGVPAAHDLTRFTFPAGTPTNPASGYVDKEMLLGTAEDGKQAILFCYKDTGDKIVPPDCYRQYELTEGVSVKYYFKRPYLPEWREIDTKVRRFVADLAGGQG
ncbi:hypothetical protein [Parvularcula oceani]|uniref:hypothetical protein n=1 Tax=Parvularcula oceani TaxID=1247963 RepID=UPI0004E14AB5|nr:hypothetical protein [Parvularcula oceani]